MRRVQVILMFVAVAIGPVSGDDRLQMTAFSYTAHREVVVPVTINGQGPFPFVLDTGSSHTSISTELAQRLDAVAVAKTAVSSPAGVELCPVVNLQRLAVGPIVADSVLATEVSSAKLDEGGKVQGVLGQDVIGAERYAIDFRSRRIEWSPAADSDGELLALHAADGIFLVELPQRDRVLRLVPDSGAEGLVLFERGGGNLPPLQLLGGLSWLATITDRIQVRRAHVAELRIGSESLMNQPAYVLDRRGSSVSDGDGLLPLQLFERVTFDGLRGTIALKAP